MKPHLAAALFILPVLAVEAPAQEARQDLPPCVPPQNLGQLLFGGCVSSDQFYEWEEEALRQKVIAGTATPYETASYHMLRQINEPSSTDND